MKKNPKISKGRANYRPSTSDIENCKNCRFFLYNVTGGQHGCQVVEGQINPAFVSDLFQPQVNFGGESGSRPEAFPIPFNNPKHTRATNEEDKVYSQAGMQMGASANPLLPGFSREVVSENIGREIRAGREQDQAVAIALDNARREFRKKHKRGRFPKYLQEKNPPFAKHVAAGEPWAVEAAHRGKKPDTSVSALRSRFDKAVSKLGSLPSREAQSVINNVPSGLNRLEDAKTEDERKQLTKSIESGIAKLEQIGAKKRKNPSCPSCNNPISNPSTLTPGDYTCTGCGSSITVAKANPIHSGVGGKFTDAIVLGAGIATGSVIANKVLSGKKK